MDKHYIVKEETLINIADAIRNKIGDTGSFTPNEMDEGIHEVYDKGVSEGKHQISDIFQLNGTRTDYSYTFAHIDCSDLDLQHPINAFTGEHCFYNNKTPNIAEWLYLYNIKLILGTVNHIGNMSYFFYKASTSELPELEVYGHTPTQFFGYCRNLETIRKLTIHYNARWNTAFDYCDKLKNIEFGGEIPMDISFKHCPLTVKSLKSVITHLANYAGNTTKEYAYTVTFKTSTFEALESEGFTEEDKEWLASVGQVYSEDLTWATVIDNLKWNLVKA